MKTGFSKICITPPIGVPMRGYYEKRITKGILDDLYATAVSFFDGEKRAIILAVDVCVMSNAQAIKARKQISDTTGVDFDAIFINCSHTHTGPAIEADCLGEKTNCEYDSFFFEKLSEVTNKSLLDMKESSFYFGHGSADGISFVRRYRMKNGSVQTNPGVGNPNIAHPLGTPDETVSYLKIERENAENIVFVNFGTHADTIGGEFISGDWPSFLCKTVEAVFENTKCVFLTGSQGDVNHINPTPSENEKRGLDYNTFDGVPRGYEHAKYMGRKVAAAVIAGLDKAEHIDCNKITYGEKELEFPSNQENEKILDSKRILELHASGKDVELKLEKMELTTLVAEAERIVSLKDGPEKFVYTVIALKIGDFVFAGLPGECFVDIGRTIKSKYGSKPIFVCCLTNGGDSYFPTSAAYDEGGYEARSSELKKGGDKLLIEGFIQLLNELE